jgi:uroporphyrinogen-III decarboxylase
MNPTERIVAVIDGNELDRVQTYCEGLDDWPVQQVLGKPIIPPKILFKNPLSQYITKWLGNHSARSIRYDIDETDRAKAVKKVKKFKKMLVDPFVTDNLTKRIETAVSLGFDSVHAGFDGRWMIWDENTLAVDTGSFYDWVDDGHGNMYYKYRGPAIPTSKAFDEWPYFPDTDDMAHRCYNFYRRVLPKYSDKICIIGDIMFGIHETLYTSVGFQNFVIAIRKDHKFIQRFIDYKEEFIFKSVMAMMDAGVKVILKGDDMSFKTGPMLNPKTIDEFFGPPYTQLCKAVHDRGGRIMNHSCGDNTKLFDLFIKWGYDGGHAFETTSNVDIAYEKKTHGDRYTIVGGMGVDYILTSFSKPEEVREAARNVIKTCAPGGRFLLSMAHTHPELDIEKVKIMLEVAKDFGRYPIK